ncbi:17764_t:CDS:2, partial [Cetraspora pellucida]
MKKPIISYKQIIKTDTALVRSDLALAYQDFGYNALLISKYYGFYESASYTQNDGYAMVKGIFKHKNNDSNYYLFVYVNWFEDTSRKHIKVNCPIFVLHQDTS